MTKSLHFPAYPFWSCSTKSFLNMCLLCSWRSFILFSFFLIVSLCSKVVCLGCFIVWAPAIVSFLSISVTSECLDLCSWATQSVSLLNLSSVYGQLAFDISFVRWFCAFSLGLSYLVASSIVVFCSMPKYVSLCLCSADYAVHCYSWSCCCFADHLWQFIFSSSSLSKSCIPNNVGIFPGTTKKLYCIGTQCPYQLWLLCILPYVVCMSCYMHWVL